MFDITQEELTALNPALYYGVEIGMILKVPAKIAVVNENKKEYKSLSKK